MASCCRSARQGKRTGPLAELNIVAPGLDTSVGLREKDELAKLRIVAIIEAAVLKALPERLPEEFLTRTVNVSIRELNAIFEDVRGVNLHAALRGLRLDELRRRLEADPGLSAGAAARQCGFGYFPLLQRLFRARFSGDLNDFRATGQWKRPFE
jgi:transcriptional regulator GlxA family with amidase domain